MRLCAEAVSPKQPLRHKENIMRVCDICKQPTKKCFPIRVWIMKEEPHKSDPEKTRVKKIVCAEADACEEHVSEIIRRISLVVRKMRNEESHENLQ